MKDSYSFDVDDAGLDASYQKHRDAYMRIFDRLGFEYVIVKATSGAMGGSKSEEFLAKADVGEDTYVRCTNVRLRRQRRGRAGARCPPRCRTTTRRPRTPSRRRTRPTIETLVDHLNEKFPRDDRPWAAADTLKNVLVVLKHPDGTREPVAIGVPGDREVDQKRLEGQLEPTEVEPFDEAEFEKFPALAKGYIGPGVLGEEQRHRHPLPRRSPGRRGDPLGDRRRRRRQPRPRPGGRARLHPRRHDRGGRRARRRPVPELRRGHPGVRPRHRDGPHLPARPQVRRGARPAGARRAGQAGHGHHGLLRHRPLPGRGGDRRGHARRHRAVLAAQRRARRRTPRGRRQGRGDRLRGGADRRTSWTAPAWK